MIIKNAFWMHFSHMLTEPVNCTLMSTVLSLVFLCCKVFLYSCVTYCLHCIRVAANRGNKLLNK